MSIHSFRFPTDIRFGPDSIKSVPDLLTGQGVHKPLIVTDERLRDLSFFREFEQSLKDKGLSTYVYSDFSGNPIKRHVIRGAEAFKECGADAVVSIGGGCALDVGKAVALMATHPGDLFDYEDGLEGAKEIKDCIPFTLSIPTTAGTGSEVGGSSVISDDQTHKKVIIWSSYLVPSLVIADPCLLVGLPASVTAATGIDALTHNIEAYLAKNFHPMCEGIAIEGIRLVFQHLEKSVRQPENIEARSGMLMASMMGAVAFQKGMGVTHSCAHALSTCFDVHHGLANALMLTACLRFNQDHVGDKLQHLAKVLGAPANKGSEAFISMVEALIKNVGINHKLSDLGASISEKLVTTAFQDPCHQNNPKSCRLADFSNLFETVFAS
ncbi:MAG: iron-containing alcohol dehydrogenase [Oligoflexales bacterium]|nr:iron-containing alcohol dehydrogenase [Oligoflexales bacterium]